MTTLVQSFQTAGRKWLVKHGNIIDEPADILICSANVSLNLSGGVGADLLGRYGRKMQQELHRAIASRTPRTARLGEVIGYADNSLPYKAILHAVGVDGWYQTTSEIVEQTVRKALLMAGEMGARKVALTALATGFGNLSLEEFAAAIRPLMAVDFSPVSEVCLCLMEDYRASALAGFLRQP